MNQISSNIQILLFYVLIQSMSSKYPAGLSTQSEFYKLLLVWNHQISFLINMYKRD